MEKLLKYYSGGDDVFDEVFDSNGETRTFYDKIQQYFNQLDIDTFVSLNDEARLSFLNQGITYALYQENETKETIFPFDLLPRVINNKEWEDLHAGILQRNTALNMFIHDVYHDGRILKEKIVPENLVRTSTHYLKEMEGFNPPGGIYTHICGTDLIRHADGAYYVLEDNLRSPSGVSYVLSNRITLSRTMPAMFRDNMVYQVSQYPMELRKTLESVSPRDVEDVKCVVLTPGQYNSAYYEHSYLAKLMGIDLVQGRDLFVDKGVVYMNSIAQKQRVDVIYRRIDDMYLDPLVFRPDSMLGVPGLMHAYLSGNVTIVNAPGTGISDDKAVCAYVPDMIKFYLDEDPLIQNVPTYICEKSADLQYTLDHIEKLVVKPVDMSGGYGVTVVDTLTKTEVEELKLKIKSDPRNFIAQPKMMLSTHPTFIDDSNAFEPRHIDLRTFTLIGKNTSFVLHGGLSRVALKKGSLIVNSSQGGGSKDTWVLMK